MRPAEGRELFAIRLEEHQRYYTPKGWRGPIHDYDFIHLIAERDVDTILDLYAKNELDKFDSKWYIQDAIRDFIARNPELVIEIENLQAKELKDKGKSK